MDLPDPAWPFGVVCDASDFFIGCVLLQDDPDCHVRVVAYESRHLKSEEKDYPVHNKDLRVMKYAIVKFRVRLLNFKTL